MATCTVTGISRRPADASTLMLAKRRLRAMQVADHRLPETQAGRRRPSLMAPFNSRPVSSAMPNRPGPSASSTSSEVEPDRASSKSWITPAPFVAMADTNPRSIRSMTTGESPVLSTCAPRPQMMPCPPSRAARIAATTALKSAAARMTGRLSISPATPLPALYGLAKSAAFALLWRRRQRIGLHARQVELFVAELHGGDYSRTSEASDPSSPRSLDISIASP